MRRSIVALSAMIATALTAPSARADEVAPGATQYALVAVVTLCALLTVVMFVLWRNQPETDAELLESHDSQT